jgi:hypothetical protein
MRRRSAVLGSAPFRRPFVRASIDRFVQVMRGFFNVKVLVLTLPLDEVVFLLRGRLVLAPCVPFVEHEFSGVDELLGVFEGVPAEFHGHDPAPQDIPDVRVVSTCSW